MKFTVEQKSSLQIWRDLGLKTWHSIRNPYMYIQRVHLKWHFTFTDELQLFEHFAVYRIAGKFGGELNLAVWRYALKPPN